MTARQETQAVKTALAEAGIKATVKHGTGTASYWIHVRLETNWYTTNGLRESVIEIAQKVTGRHGDYDGCINVHSPLN